MPLLSKEDVQSFFNSPGEKNLAQLFNTKDRSYRSWYIKDNFGFFTLNTVSSLPDPGVDQLRYSGKGSFGEYSNLDYLLWFDFPDSNAELTVYLLIISCSDLILNEVSTDYILVSNSDGANHTRFCEGLPADLYSNYISRFGNQTPAYGVNCYAKLSQPQIEQTPVLDYLIPKGIPFDVVFTDQHADIPAGFNLLMGNSAIGDQNQIRFTGLSLDCSLLSNENRIIRFQPAFFLEGGIEISGLTMDFKGHYPGNGEISLYGAVKKLPPALTDDHPAETGWLKNLEFESSMALFFDENFSISGYELAARAKKVNGLIPENALKIPVNIAEAGITIEGENFSTTPSVELSFTTTLFDTLAIDTVMSYPEKQIAARLNKEGEKWSLSKLLAGLGYTPPHALANLVISDFELEARLPEKKYGFSIELESVLDLGVFKLENLYTGYRYDGGNDPPTGELSVGGIFDIGGVTFLAHVSYSGSEEESNFTITAENAEDTPVKVGEFIEKLVRKFDIAAIELPDAILDFEIDSVSLNFESTRDSKKFEFEMMGNSTLDNLQLAWNIALSFEKQNNTASEEVANPPSAKNTTACQLTGGVTLEGCRFALTFRKEDDRSVFLATLSGENDTTSVTKLIEKFILKEEGAFPADIDIPLPEIFFILQTAKGEEGVRLLFGIDLGLSGKIDFSELPAIGVLLKGKVDIAINALRIVGCNGDVDEESLDLMNVVLEENQMPELSAHPGDAVAAVLRKGMFVQADLQLAEYALQLKHFFEIRRKKGEKPDDGTTDVAPESGNRTQSLSTQSDKKPAVPAESKKEEVHRLPASAPVGRRLGPLLIDKIGLNYQNGKISLQFTGGIMVGPFTMELIELTMSSPANRFDPEFDLSGLSAGYDKPPLQVSGILQKHSSDLGEGRKISGFRGGISVGIKKVAITAIAAYDREESPDSIVNSFFIYGFLSAPLGGPPFLYVTGLALGGGFNRGLNTPEPEFLPYFSLTAAALSPGGMTLDFEALERMQLDFPVKDGAYWIAAGVRFESFKFLSGFLMLTLEFGEETKIGVIGMLDASITAGKDREIARLSLGFTATYLPDRGVIGVRGAFLPTTFIFHKDVKVQGGMAFLAIFKDQNHGEWKGAKAGEFVLTLGGYGSQYKPKPYYPAVAALQLSWRVSDLLTLSASAYFAVTPEAIMLGGMINGLFSYKKRVLKHDLSLVAHFTVSVDFILYWQPVRYLGTASAEFQVTGRISGWLIRESIRMGAAAEMTIWGPEFSGRALLKLNILRTFTLEVEFGEAERSITPLTWSEFRERLLPVSNKVVSLNLAGGSLPETAQKEVPSVDPQNMLLIMDTQIPVKKQEFMAVYQKEIGIKPMGLTSSRFESEAKIIISYNGKEDKELNKKLDITPVLKNVPSALWQPAVTNGVIPPYKKEDPGLIEGVICGYEIRLKRPDTPDSVTMPFSVIDDILQGYVASPVQSQRYAPLSRIPDLAPDETIIHIFYPS